MRLVGPQGIFKPRGMSLPLSILTTAIVEGRDRPYEDELSAQGLLLYRYRGEDRNHRDNTGLREAMRTNTPLIYFYGIVPGWYAAVWPTYIVGDAPELLTFTVAVDEPHVLAEPRSDPLPEDARRRYATRVQLQRLHQVGFRQKVISAYRQACAVCRLRHAELLDAAHIVPDRSERGLPIVSNGVALCKLHHAAFDRHILGVRPDLRVEISLKVLEEIDGPMLVHGLQGFHQVSLTVPSRREHRPDADLLAERYELFRQAG